MASTRRSTRARSRRDSRRSFTARRDPSSSDRDAPEVAKADRGGRAGRPIRARTSSTGSSSAPATRSRTSALGLGRRRMAPMASLRPVSRSRHRVSDTLARRAASRRRSPRCSRCSASQRPNSTHCCDSSTLPACRLAAPESSRSARRATRRGDGQAFADTRRAQVRSPKRGVSAGSSSARRGLDRSRVERTGSCSPQSAAISGSSQATPSSSAGL